MIRTYDEFDKRYKQYLIEHNYAYLAELAGAFQLRAVPTAAMVGNGEVWISHDMNARRDCSFYFQGNLTKGDRQ